MGNHFICNGFFLSQSVRRVETGNYSFIISCDVLYGNDSEMVGFQGNSQVSENNSNWRPASIFSDAFVSIPDIKIAWSLS